MVTKHNQSLFMLTILTSFLTASMLMTLAPGPDLLMVVSQSIFHGFWSAIRFILGLITGLCFHTLLLVLGWAQLIGERPEVILLFKLFGGGYFIVLGVLNLLSSQANNHMKNKERFFQGAYQKGVAMNLLNPKVSLFFWLFFPGFLFSSTLPVSSQYLVLGGLFILQAVIIFSIVAYFSTAFHSLYQRKSLPKLQGILLICIGLYLLMH